MHKLVRFIEVNHARDREIICGSVHNIETRWQRQGQAGGAWCVDAHGEDAAAYLGKLNGKHRVTELGDGTVRVECGNQQEAGQLAMKVNRARTERGLEMHAQAIPLNLSRQIAADATRDDFAGELRNPLDGVALKVGDGQKAAVIQFTDDGTQGILVILVPEAMSEDGVDGLLRRLGAN